MLRKTILITGSSRGLGKSLALAFASKGYNIILHGRNEEKLSAVKEDVLRSKVNCPIVVGDIVDEKTITNLTACAKKNGIDILINNAGVYIRKPVEEMTPSEFKKIIEVNLIAPVLLTKNIFELFKRRKSGLIININSIAGKDFSHYESAYCASKHGLRGFMGTFKFEALKYNVAVIDIYLEAMNTDMTTGRKDTNKFIKTEEVAEFLCLLFQNYPSMRISEIEIFRKIY